MKLLPRSFPCRCPLSVGLLYGLAILLLFDRFDARAQWVTQTFVLKPGWNAVYLHVDSSYDTLDNLVGPAAIQATPIDEIWMWAPPVGTGQFVQNPVSPTNTGSRWRTWKRGNVAQSNLERLVGNVACLVFSSAAADFTWQLKGQAKVLDHQWTSSGLNFVGFPTVPTNPPNFEAFLSESPALYQNAEVFEYVGGALGPTNPSQVFAYRTTSVERGKAYWVRANNVFNRYYGPFDLTSVGPDGLQFGERRGVARIRLRNQSTNPIVVTAEHLASEAAPPGQSTVAGSPPLLVRGPLNPVDLSHGFSSLVVGESHSWNLAPMGQSGSEVEVVVGLNRAAITQNPGDLLASLIRFKDSLGQTSLEVPVSAQVGSLTGLWVGQAWVTQVRAFLKSYQRDLSGNLITSTQSDSFGSYIVTSVNNAFGPVPRPFPLRLILHSDGTQTQLLQRAFYGLAPNGNFINATEQRFLDPAHLDLARRVSAVHLPFKQTNVAWQFDNVLRRGATMVTTVSLPHDDHASNPFLHTYHPDHDNLDASFSAPGLTAGFESYQIERKITLTVNPPENTFAAITSSGQSVSGVYSEVVTLVGKQTTQGPEAKTFESQGNFLLHRINTTSTLTSQ